MPIQSNTILTLDNNGGIQNEWGSGLFFMPHHLTIDSQNNVWVTDVALHQIFKFPPYGGKGEVKTPLIRLGTKVNRKLAADMLPVNGVALCNAGLSVAFIPVLVSITGSFVQYCFLSISFLIRTHSSSPQ